ncbi:MAG TPA: hypothetical protein VF278_04355 [Pirellulales bacterium]
MSETWLRPNRRILAVAAVLPLALLLAGGALVYTARPWGDRGGLLVAGVVAAGVALLALVFLLVQALQPRLAIAGRHMIVNLGTARPIRVPLDVVEGFLLGQGPSFLPGQGGKKSEVANLVVRLAERATEWEGVEVNRQFGTWCGHYITIRGTWCERLNVAVVNRLNARLVEVRKTLEREAAR